MAQAAPDQPDSPQDTSPPSSRKHIGQQLRDMLHSPEFRPAVLPQTAIELMNLSRDPDVNFSKVSEVVEREPILAADVLDTARSALYSRGNPIESLDAAMVRLGVSGVTGIFVTAALRKTALNCRLFARTMDQLRRHMVATGHIAKGLCRTMKVPGDRAFVCGLLHDIGMAGSLTAIAELPQKERPTDLEAIRLAASDVHEEASSIMGIRWNLPWATQWVIGHHHSYLVDGRVSPLAALTLLACHLASETGAPALEESDEQTTRQAMEYFEFSGNTEQRLKDRCKRIVDLID